MTPEPGSQGSGESLIQAAGSFRWHRAPSGGNTRSTVPSNSYGIRSRIVLVPYPELLGAPTTGPPISCHSNTRSERGRPFTRRSHRIDTRPFLVESAPYFAALVASSWITIAIA